MKYLNLGCGDIFHHEWINIDYHSTNPHVIPHDLLTGIPFPDESIDVVYHNNVLEHFRPHEALFLMKECYRVLKPDAIVRVVVPDLEDICRTYVNLLNILKQGNNEREADYEWILIELFDQMVREKTGGQMLDYLRRDLPLNEDFVIGRIGETGRDIRKNIRLTSQRGAKFPHSKFTIKKFINQLPLILKFIKKKTLIMILGSKDFHAFEIGQFRLSGEVHQWMYDEYSLKKLLLNSGFIGPLRYDARNSQILDWERFNLDTLPDGSERLTKALFMEALKPKSL